MLKDNRRHILGFKVIHKRRTSSRRPSYQRPDSPPTNSTGSRSSGHLYSIRLDLNYGGQADTGAAQLEYVPHQREEHQA
jgi:hypothetical protein